MLKIKIAAVWIFFFFHCSPVCWSLDYLVSNPNWYLIFSGFQNFFFQTKKSNFLVYLNICTWTVKQKRSLKDKLWSVQRWSFSDILKQLFKEEFICAVFIQNVVKTIMKPQLKMFWTVKVLQTLTLYCGTHIWLSVQ